MDRLPAGPSTLDQRSISIKMDRIFSCFWWKKKKKKRRKAKWKIVKMRLQIWKDAPEGVFYSWDESVWKEDSSCLEINLWNSSNFFLTCILYLNEIQTDFSVELSCHKNEIKTFSRLPGIFYRKLKEISRFDKNFIFVKLHKIRWIFHSLFIDINRT